MDTHEVKFTDNYPSLANGTASLFRYDRWDKLLLLAVSVNIEQQKLFLAFYNCDFLEFDNHVNVNIDQMTILQDLEALIIKESSSHFLLKCNSIELWNEDKFKEYDKKLYIKLGEEKRYGIRKPILSIEEI
ncbi:hypothetical protein [Dulcicalothrix desertica]|nr:hypothetical protein [Dulcicalothrix desertica]TWH50227.1 hypothetical protein CAL7102_04519 [Dulcicalothrix desertica PCC 7102]